MNYVDRIKQLFPCEEILFDEKVGIFSADLKPKRLPSYSQIKDLIIHVPSRDSIKVSLRNLDSENVIFSTDVINIDESKYTELIEELCSDDLIEVYIEIIKDCDSSTLSIYCFEKFFEYLSSLDMFSLMRSFSSLLRNKECLNFVVFDEQCSFMTKTMSFSSDVNASISSDFSRLDRLKSISAISRDSSVERLYLVPDDFRITVRTECNVLEEIFSNIWSVLSLMAISTSSNLDSEHLCVQIGGQRYLNYEVNISDVKSNEELYKIYNWVYTDGNPVDKSIIASNVMSLHCRYTSIFDIQELVFASIQSNYNLYLRKDVDRYLEVKNKASEYICDVVAKTGDYATIICDKFKQNLIAILGFFFTTIIANIVSVAPLENIFTRDISLVLEVVLVCSVLFLVVSLFEVNYKIKKVKNSYEVLKDNYRSVFSDADIMLIFNDDKTFKEMEKEISTQTKVLSFVWLMAIVLLFVFVEWSCTEELLVHAFKDFIIGIFDVIKDEKV